MAPSRPSGSRGRAEVDRPLAGITVVSLEQAVAAPFATRQLADLGARIVKVERPGGGDFARRYDARVRGQSSYFVWLNRSKESVVLNLKDERASRLLDRLVERADVFVHNLAPGAVERLGFGAERLRDRHPRLVVCEISGYGSDGPYRDRKAYDLLVQAEAGVLSVTGTPGTPSKVGVSIGDIAAGMYAYSGILTALLARERTGDGTLLRVSLFDALAEWMSHPAYHTAYGDAPPQRTGPRHASIAPYGPFRCGDGRTIFLGVQNEREWARLCELVLDDPELAGDPRFRSNEARVANRDELRATLEAALSGYTKDAAREALEAAGIAHASMNDVRALLDHPQLRERDRWHEVGTPAGTIRALLPPVLFEGVEPRMDPIPAAGAHTREVLADLGVEEDELAALEDAGAIESDVDRTEARREE